MEILNKEENINKINKYSLLRPIKQFTINDIKKIEITDKKILHLLDIFGLSFAINYYNNYLYKNRILVYIDENIDKIIYIDKLSFILFNNDYYLYTKYYNNNTIIYNNYHNMGKYIETKLNTNKFIYSTILVAEKLYYLIKINKFKFCNNIYIIKYIDYDDDNFSELDAEYYADENNYKLYI